MMFFHNSFKNNRLLINMTVNDLKSLIGLSHSKPKEGMAHEYRENNIFSNHSTFAASRIPKMRQPLQRRLQDPKLFMPRSVSGDGLRPTDLPRKSSGHRSLSPSNAHETLPHGYSRGHRSKYIGPNQRNKGLAHVFRFRPRSESNA